MPVNRITAFFKRYYWLGAFLAMLALVLVLKAFSPQQIFAAVADYESTNQKFKAVLEGYSMPMFKYMQRAYQQFSDFVNPNSTTPGLQMVSSIQTFITAMGEVLLVLFMLINMINEAKRGDVGWEYWLKVLATTLVATLLVFYIDNIMGAIYNLGNFFVERVSNGMSQTAATGAANINANSKQVMVDAISQIPGFDYFKNIYGETPGEYTHTQLQEADGLVDIFRYIVYLPMLMGMFLIYSTMFEVKLRQFFAPMAVATIAGEGARSSGVRYIKKFFACYIKISIYFVVAGIGSMMTNFFYLKLAESVAGLATVAAASGAGAPSTDVALQMSSVQFNVYLNLILMVMANIIAAMTMMQTGGLADEVIGV